MKACLAGKTNLVVHKEPLNHQQLSIDRLPNHVANIYEAAIRITHGSQGATQRMLLNQKIIRKLKQKKVWLLRIEWKGS
jgi:hypothetical protein